MRKKRSNGTVLELDLGGLSGGYRREYSMSCKKKVPMDEKASAGGNSNHGWTFTGIYGGFCFLRLAYAVTETP